MKRRIVLVFITIPYILIGQSIFSGKVIDENKNPIPFCNVLLISPVDNKNFNGGTTDENGYFEIETDYLGSIKIKISNIGFQDYVSERIIISKINSEFKLGEILLNDEAFALKGVSVVAKKTPIEKKIDRTVINLEDDPGTTGSTILDVLERTPGVIVDRQNESINMLGKGGVNVMINGKITYMPSSALVQYLNGINAENVKSI